MSLQFDLVASAIAFWQLQISKATLKLEAKKTVTDYMKKMHDCGNDIDDYGEDLRKIDGKIDFYSTKIAKGEIEAFHPVTFQVLKTDFTKIEKKLSQKGDQSVAIENVIKEALRLAESKYGKGLKKDIKTSLNYVDEKLKKLKKYVSN